MLGALGSVRLSLGATVSHAAVNGRHAVILNAFPLAAADTVALADAVEARLTAVRERSADGCDKFVSREITVAAGDDERTLVAHGLRDGERIAAQGAFDLLAAGGGG